MESLACLLLIELLIERCALKAKTVRNDVASIT